MSTPKGRRAVLAGMLALMSAGSLSGAGPLHGGAGWSSREPDTAPDAPGSPRASAPETPPGGPRVLPGFPRDLRDLPPDLRDLPPDVPGLWPGEVTAVRGEHSLVLGHRVPSTALRDLAVRADQARRAVGAVWGPVRALVLFPATDAEAAALAGAGSTRGLAAMATADRVIVLPSGYARLTPTGRDVVVAHELTHVATGATRGGRVPVWLSEGFADYVGYRDAPIPVREAAAELATEVRAGTVPVRLPVSADFAPGAPRLAQAYEEAWLACRFIAERFGERALVRLYGNDVGSTLGLPEAGLTEAWRDYLRRELT
ncbi:hypothetical protein FHS43_003161 [Streptosporangium becharense]|uniref:DUF4157 domain-containing protein n=1 Tax=Streptosporangium becharense TaxID=1816182 RepID=A0A7W9MFK9_9ACTN|nr:hypothetical protein [Streptosporangium becharense]MBB2911881.1 hypothetical protein [Streptosporangium becharense]MBB5818428.1 hypothetical protein [Streptosporangium becharense]